LRFLLDTHSLLWFLTGDEGLSDRARRIIENPDCDILVSVACLWEIAIKQSLGKLKLARPFDALFPDQLASNSISLLGIRLAHLSEISRMPFHHRDPFDRLLVAQSLSEEIPLLSNDDTLDSYGLERIW
jgi:PIN domain nuclease of toxin-antitoxin system